MVRIARRLTKHGFAIAHTPQTQQRKQSEKRGREQNKASDPQEYRLKVFVRQQRPKLPTIVAVL